VYIKPAHGSLGLNIIRAKRKSDGQVLYQEKVKEGSRNGTSGSVSMFLKKFAARFLKGKYVIQETLYLMTFQNRPFDIRLVLQKDSSGQWKRTKTFCRVAQAGEITSNLSTGGDAITVKQLLQDVLRDTKRVDRAMKEIRKIAAEVPVVIEREVGSTIGELGLDLGLDTRGRVWVIEINSKPWKKPNIEESEFPEIALQAFERPVQFGRYLCETDTEL
jgi:glutathione synthase/RimK-type ligase-like ATP-grasp enzyme